MQSPEMHEPMQHEIRGVSIVIPNYNYGRFIGEAIDSALAQTHPLVEVIVVDDGSTDDSRAVIERYGERVTAIFQANAGQNAACAAGFARAHFDLVVFVDSDDVLLPEAAATIAAHWRPGTAKLQFKLETIDGAGRRTGFRWPKYPDAMAPERVLTDLLTTGAYPSPPTSGNAYARHLLDAATPFEGHSFVDSVVNTIAPLYGEVHTLDAVLALYRVHGSNNWAQQTMTPERFAYYAASERRRMAILATHCARLDRPFAGPGVIENALYLREVELVRSKLARGGGIRDLAGNGIRAIRVALAQPGGGTHRLLRAAWAAAVVVAPRPLAERLIAMRFVQAARPRLAERLISRLERRADARRPPTQPAPAGKLTA